MTQPSRSSRYGGRAYPTICFYCGQSVFFYENDDGSSVFFEELGGDWPKHVCYDRIESGTNPKFFVKSWTGMPIRELKKRPKQKKIGQEWLLEER